MVHAGTSRGMHLRFQVLIYYLLEIVREVYPVILEQLLILLHLSLELGNLLLEGVYQDGVGIPIHHRLVLYVPCPARVFNGVQ
mmetsp:Transcript_35035/g.34051  ORF Transcript_35035/g.34051 Transcript_35035/m.34051 type:complete len:83 (-) Transcript_35035:1122-1370(-)